MDDYVATMDDYDEAFDEPEDINGHQSCSTIEVISMDSLLAAEKKILQKVMDLLLVKEYQARALLIKHQWSFDRLMEIYVDKGPDICFSEAGVFTAHEKKDLIRSPHHIDQQSALACNICFNDFSAKLEALTMDCGHFFCTACWTEYFKVKIEEGKSKQITCMAEKCNVVCGEETVRKLVKAKHIELAARFDRHVLASFVEDNKAIKWCPSVPHCGNAIRVDGLSAWEVVEVECSCGHQFCFNCLSQPHSPCTCAMWSRWSSQYDANKTSVAWIKNNTKPCPRCHKRISKISGCNVMTCKCGQQFCWVCGEAGGYGHSCNRYNEKTTTKSVIATINENAGRDMKEYYHFLYFNERYVEHSQSLKLEASLTEKVKKSIVTADEMVMSTDDFSWLTDGLYMLFRCRKALSFTYPFTYYVFGNIFEGETLKKVMLKKDLFEDHQEQFQHYVERLSKSVEVATEKLDEETRMEVITLTSLANSMCEELYKFIENEILSSLPEPQNYYIAPYKSFVERDSELS